MIQVHDTLVMKRVTRGVDELQRTTGKLDPLAIPGRHHMIGSKRHDLTIEPVEHFGAIHHPRGRDELCGLYEMRRTPGMQHRSRIWQCLHQRARAAGMVQMNVSQDHVIDGAAGDAQLVQRA
jgi:hypothetical protein